MIWTVLTRNMSERPNFPGSTALDVVSGENDCSTEVAWKTVSWHHWYGSIQAHRFRNMITQKAGRYSCFPVCFPITPGIINLEPTC